MKRICEFCRKEYEWEEGQLNWGKNGLKHGKGSVDCKKYCYYNCGKKAYKQHCQETNLKRYGVMNTFQVPEFKEKAKRTWIKKYGDENYSNREKARKTIFERYGVNNPFELDEIKEKAKKTMRSRYGVDFYVQTEEFNEKAHQIKKEHGTYGKSKEEDEIGELLYKNLVK